MSPTNNELFVIRVETVYAVFDALNAADRLIKKALPNHTKIPSDIEFVEQWLESEMYTNQRARQAEIALDWIAAAASDGAIARGITESLGDTIERLSR